MTLLELAGAGALAAGAAVATLEALEGLVARPGVGSAAALGVGKRVADGGLVETAWGAVLGLAALVYLALNFATGVAPTPRHLLCVGFLLLWSIWYTCAAWSRRRAHWGPVWPPPPLSLRLRRGWRATVRIFLASAPVLLVLAESHSSAWDWSEALAVAATITGWGLVLVTSRHEHPRQVTASLDPLTAGFVVAYLGIYALTLATTSGFLTFFAVVVVARHCGRTLTPNDVAAQVGEALSIRREVRHDRQAPELTS